MTQPVEGPTASETVCFRHKNRPTNVRCQNCGKPICADCMRDSPVGYRCPDCAPQRKFALADDLAVTKAIIGINVAVFVAGIVWSLIDGAMGDPLTGGSDQLTKHGGLIVSACTQVVQNAAGQSLCGGPLGVSQGEWWRLFTSGFLHSGLLHIGFNMYFIWVFGQLLEPALGRVRFALLYVAGLLGGSIGAMLYSGPTEFTVGASGAAFALLGAALVVARLRRIDGLANNLLGVAAINFAIGFLPGLNISIGGHVGGFLVGGAAGYLLFGPLARRPQAAVGVLAALAVVLFVAGILVADARSILS